MTDTAGITQGIAIFGGDSFAPTAAPSAPQAARSARIHLAPVLIGAGVAYGIWRTRKRL